MRGERVFALEVDLFDRLVAESGKVNVTPAWQFVEQSLEVFRRRPSSPLFFLRGQHQQVLRTGEGGIEQPPEIEVLDVVEWLEAFLREVAAIFQ